jgi:hypothetical protein
VIAQERAEHAETVLDATTDPVARERIARETLEALRAGSYGAPAKSRLRRLLGPWEHQLHSARGHLERERAESLRRRRRALGWSLPAAAAVVWLAGWGLGWMFGLGAEDPLDALARELGGTLAAPFELRTTGGRPDFDKAGAYGELSDFVQHLERARVDPAQWPVRGAQQLVRAVGGVVNKGPEFALPAWAAEFATAIDGYRTELARATDRAPGAAAASLLSHLRRFGERALAAGLFIAVVDAESAPQKQALAPVADRAPPEVRAAVEPWLK